MTMASGELIKVARSKAGLTQTQLARRANISRQALGALEANLYQPNVNVALRLAKVVGVSVESLFGNADGDDIRSIDVRWKPSVQMAGQSCARVALARVGGKLIAVSQPAAVLTLSPVSGLLDHAKRGRAKVVTLLSQNEVDSTLLIAGCDPAVSILTAWLARQRSAINAVGLPCSSAKALVAVAGGCVHTGGVHLRDPESGEYNLAPVRRGVGRRSMVLVNFAQWELGLVTASGNPREIREFEDLARKEVTIVNREFGSGARYALDEAIVRMGFRGQKINGYDRELGGHLDVAAAIATKEADTGVTIRVAAEVYGLGFIPLREERYDLVIPESEMESIPVKSMLDALNSRRFSREISQLCGYATEQMGQVVGRIN